MQLTSHIIRLALDAASNAPALDAITSESPVLWRGNDVTFQLGLFQAGTLIDPSNLASVTLEVKSATDRGGPSLMRATVAEASFNVALTADNWANNAGQHVSVGFAGSATALDLGGLTEATFWVTVFGLTASTPAARITLGYTTLRVIEDGSTDTGLTSPVPTVGYWTKDEADARYAVSVPLTTIQGNIATLQGQMTAVTATANAAVPSSSKGAANGVPSLDSGGHIPASQLPAAIPAPSSSTPATLAVGQAPSAGSATTYLRSDALPGLPGLATETSAGFMSAADKIALDGIAGGIGGSGVGFNGPVSDILITSDGVYCAGIFTQYGNQNANSIVRLSTTGVLDTVWETAWLNSIGGSIPTISRLAVASDGDILALASPSADFTATAAYNPATGASGSGYGYINQPVLKFNSAGGLDSSWQLGSPLGLTSGQTVRDIAGDSSGHVVIITDTTLRVVDLTGASVVAKAATGKLRNLAPFTGSQVYLTSTCFQTFTVPANYDGNSNSRGLKLINAATGAIDATWLGNAGTGANAASVNRAIVGSTVAEGTFVIAGITLNDVGTDVLPVAGADFTWNGANGTRYRGGLLKILSTGLPDTSFSILITLSGEGAPIPFATDSQGRIYFGGPVASINGTAVSPGGLYRVLADGTFDKEFSGFSGGSVNACALKGDNLLVIGGAFTSYHGKAVGYIIFADASGTLLTGQPAFTLADDEGLVVTRSVLPDVAANPKYARYLVIQPGNPPTINVWNASTSSWMSICSICPVNPPTLPSVAFSPTSGTAIGGGLSVTLSVPGYPGAEIRYTTAGTVPTATSTLYSGAITVGSATTIKAYARATGYTDGPVTVAQYSSTALSQTATPTFSPASGGNAPVTVTISCATAGANIYYTLDGSSPSTSSTPYTGPLTLTTAATVKAIATASGYTPSNPATASYTNLPSVPDPTVIETGPSGGQTRWYVSAGSGSPAGTVIRYTTVPAGTYTDVTSSDSIATGGVPFATEGYWGYFRAFATGYAPSRLLRVYWDNFTNSQVTELAG